MNLGGNKLNRMNLVLCFALAAAAGACERPRNTTVADADLLELVQVLKGDAFDQYRVLLTRVDPRKKRTNSAVMKALEPWKSKILATLIPQSEPLNQAQMARQDIFRFAPDSTGAAAYRELIQELKSL